MNDISITEAYFVYSVRGKGKLSGNDCRKVTGLLTAALWEMTQNGLLTLTDNRLCLTMSNTLPDPGFSRSMNTSGKWNQTTSPRFCRIIAAAGQTDI